MKSRAFRVPLSGFHVPVPVSAIPVPNSGFWCGAGRRTRLPRADQLIQFVKRYRSTSLRARTGGTVIEAGRRTRSPAASRIIRLANDRRRRDSAADKTRAAATSTRTKPGPSAMTRTVRCRRRVLPRRASCLPTDLSGALPVYARRLDCVASPAPRSATAPALSAVEGSFVFADRMIRCAGGVNGRRAVAHEPKYALGCADEHRHSAEHPRPSSFHSRAPP